ncbi:MAG: hypothetical protein AAF318_03915 [Pseudomonadota bacterium]
MFLKAFTAAATALAAFAITPAMSQTVDVLVLQEDWDAESVPRDSRIQRGMLIEFNKVLNMPPFQAQMRQYGLQGMNVYDENALALGWYDSSRVRRSDEELIQFARQIPGYSLDAIVLYTLYARAVKDPYTQVALLQSSIQYRVLSVKDGRFLDGDNMELNTSGTPLTGCAAGVAGAAPDRSCVQQFVLRNAASMANDAAAKIALRLAALLGGGASSPTPAPGTGIVLNAPGTAAPAPIAAAPAVGNQCANLPITYLVQFQGISSTMQNAAEEFMSSWACAMGLELENATLTGITFRYQTRADRRRILRNIRQMGEMMGIFFEPRLDGERTIVAEAIPIRSN